MNPESVETRNGIWRPLSALPTDLDPTDFEDLMKAAREVRANAYAPYSHFQVGAAVRMDNKIFVGSNVENASYGGTICAERAAIFSGVASGMRTLQTIAISTDAIGSPDSGNRAPCGLCRQVIAEFSTPRTIVLFDAGNSEGKKFVGEVIVFEQLLPFRFRLESES